MPKKESKSETKSESMSSIGKLFRLLVLVVCLAFITVIYMIFQPQNLSNIDGYEVSSSHPRDLKQVLTKAVEGDYSVTITEAEINQMLQRQLVAKQGGLIGESAAVKRVLVRLKENIAEVVIVREVFGQQLTTSMYLQFQQTESENGISTQLHLHGGNIDKTNFLPNVGGRFGELRIPQGFLVMVVPDFIKIADALAPEIELGFENMARFEIQNKRIILDPRKPTRYVGGDDSPF
jgi:hypothetical protein